MTTADTISKPTLAAEQFRELRDIIYEKSGIFFAEKKLYRIEYRLGRRVLELGRNSFDEYVPYIRSPWVGRYSTMIEQVDLLSG